LTTRKLFFGPKGKRKRCKEIESNVHEKRVRKDGTRGKVTGHGRRKTGKKEIKTCNSQEEYRERYDRGKEKQPYFTRKLRGGEEREDTPWET